MVLGNTANYVLCLEPLYHYYNNYITNAGRQLEYFYFALYFCDAYLYSGPPVLIAPVSNLRSYDTELSDTPRAAYLIIYIQLPRDGAEYTISGIQVYNRTPTGHQRIYPISTPQCSWYLPGGKRYSTSPLMTPRGS